MAKVPPSRADDAPIKGNPSGVSGGRLPQVRQGAPLNREVVLVSLYEDSAQRINTAVAKAITELGDKRSAEFRISRGVLLQRQIAREIRRLSSASAKAMTPIAQGSYTLGLRQAVSQMKEVGIADAVASVGGRGFDSFTTIDTRAVELVAQDTLARLTAASIDHASRADLVFRTLAVQLENADLGANRAIARGIITGNPRQAFGAMRELFADPNAPEIESYRKLGNKQIQVGDWTGTVRSYTDIVVRTRTREATVTARHNRLLENDLDLVQITGRNSVNFCTRFLGLVVSLGAARDGYPSINELPSGGPPFHPLCSKGTAMFAPDLSSSARAAANTRALPAFRRAQANGTLTDSLAV